MDWAIKNAIQEVLVLDGIPIEGIPRTQYTAYHISKYRNG